VEIACCPCLCHYARRSKTWKSSENFGIYGAEGKVVEGFHPPGQLVYNYRVDGPMIPHCPDGSHVCKAATFDTRFNSTIACGTPSVADRPSPHHCRAMMVSDTDGSSFHNEVDASETVFGNGIADLPDPGCDGGIARWESKKALVMSNVQDNGDPGIEQQPRYNLTVSISLDSGRHWPYRAIVYPAHRGAVGYSDVRVAKDGTIVVHFDTLTGPNTPCSLGMKKYCAAELNASHAGGAVEVCLACAERNRAGLESRFFYPKGRGKGEWLPSACGRSNATHVGWQPSPDQWAADTNGACRIPVAKDDPSATLIATVDGNAILHGQ
jgi:hypothetical protein